MKFPTYTPYKRLEFRTISGMHQKLELCISSGACGVVQSRMGILTGLYHVPQVFHVASSQLSYSHMLDENNDSHLMVVKHQLKLNLFTLPHTKPVAWLYLLLLKHVPLFIYRIGYQAVDGTCTIALPYHIWT